MDRNELRINIKKSLGKSLKSKEAEELDRLISKGLTTKHFHARLFESGWHVDTTGSDSLVDLARKYLTSIPRSR